MKSKHRTWKKRQQLHTKVMTIEITNHLENVPLSLSDILLQIASASANTQFTGCALIEILDDGTTRIRTDESKAND